MFKQAADIIRQADVFIITAGAGMGVDSGLPDFRGNQGFWQTYPPYARLGLSFSEAANPAHFQRDPAFGWGFYGHRCNLYRSTTPHEGFHIIRRWIEQRTAPYFVVTSNVDGQFQKAGYNESQILEVHGSIHHLQCLKPCSDIIWPNNEQLSIDTGSMRSRSVPTCPRCGCVSRPNILMFGDWSWLPQRTEEQEQRFECFLNELGEKRTVVIEMGAGTAIPTIRSTSERLGWRHANTTVLRINPREPEITTPHISLPSTALEGLRRIDQHLNA
ncbi:MAG: NAD-dependent deacetylase [Desulfuromonadales bacterium]|nr:NAD-dependent deacetylase [Desulfuromonadales bacterium]